MSTSDRSDSRLALRVLLGTSALAALLVALLVRFQHPARLYAAG